MPRYCAVKLCKNRGGIPSKDNKKISFYPFPLRDEARLQKWVDNMKREEWTPSRHQYLCSDHFTEDSFDLRWGIRYLKHTAVPTIFPFIYEGEKKRKTSGSCGFPRARVKPDVCLIRPCTKIGDEVNKLHSKKNVKPVARTSGLGVKPIRPSSPPKKRALILKRETCGQNGDVSAEKVLEPVTKVCEPQFPTVLLIRDLDPETALSREAAHATASLPGSQGALETTSPLPGGERILVTSCVSVLSESQHGSDGGSTVTVLCGETSASPEAACDGPPAAAAETVSATAGLRSESGGDCAADSPDSQAGDAEHILLYEHSYSRQNADKGQLWNKIAGLHVKITELEKREEDTVAKINSLETLIARLKKENIVCEEKQKALEEYFTSVFL
ncbi:hypothetical protein AAFF_G00356540 [Aldrovandia affinis]|uniref:THAP domain-containing protein 5 n=1 Tax=Aldrovandia affinis TaxID=143900 RepID=A0AAD7X0B9_9TELE|nr:hypothetical protein AAFF_G00356540 [Aldrovandia affinis]